MQSLKGDINISEKIETFTFDAIIIGAGIVGLSIAKELCKEYSNILVVEKENSYGLHVSSRNSEVIHSGIYYKPNSLKAKLCVEGNQLLYDFAKKYSIKYKNCGKLIIATNKDEIDTLEKILENGKKNNVKNLQIISRKEIKKREPIIKALAGLVVPSTGIIDSHSIMRKLSYLINERGSNIVYNTTVKDIIYKNDTYKLIFENYKYSAKSKIVINSAGLWSDNISKMVGINDYKIYYCKGEYYSTSMYRNKLHSLIYPIPSKISLGTHIVLKLDGSIGFGPNAYYVNKIDYKMDDSNKQLFLNSINKYLDLPENELHVDYAGIRPKIQPPGKSEHDFIIKNETDKGYNNFINLIGIESPGLTSSLAIAKYVGTIIK